jgi:hypothetical protein
VSECEREAKSEENAGEEQFGKNGISEMGLKSLLLQSREMISQCEQGSVHFSCH